jgi:Tfp pilus assembly protein PilF
MAFAQKYFEKVIQLNEKYADAHSALGTVHFHLKHPEAAFLSFNRALALNPDLKQAKKGLATLKATTN